MLDNHPKTSLLLERWHGGERQALGDLLLAHTDWLHRKVRERMSPVLAARVETGDLVQEAVLEFLESAPRFTIGNGKLFRGLLYRIVVTTVAEEARWWRARRRDIARQRPLPSGTVLNLESPVGDPSTAAGEAEREAWVRIGMEFLSRAEQEIIVLRDYDGLAYSDIAARRDKEPDAVRMEHARAVAALGKIVARLRRGELSAVLGEVAPPDGDGLEESACD